MIAPIDGRFEWLIARASLVGGEPLRVAVVHPVDATSLRGAMSGAASGLIAPILIDSECKIRAAAEEADLGISDQWDRHYRYAAHGGASVIEG